jgi:hypothetical protein
LTVEQLLPERSMLAKARMRDMLSALALTGAMALCLSRAQAQNLLANGNLDVVSPVEIVPGFFLPKPSVWVNEGTRSITGPYEDEMSSEPWAGGAPTPATTDGNGLPPPDGYNGLDGGVFLKPFTGNAPNGAATGHLYQDVPAMTGRIYRLTGWAGAETNSLMAGAELAVEFLNASSNVIPGGQIVQLLPTLAVNNGQPFNYKEYTATATAPAGTAFVRARVSMIGGMSNPMGGGQAFVVDDFSLTILQGILGDFDDDSDVDVTDYLTLSTHLFTDVSGLTLAQSYMMGDITRDFVIDGRDFTGFYRAYDDFNGLGAFVAMLAAMPEPSAGWLAACACLAFTSRRTVRRV